jgi:putative MATE family efflux protein
MNKSHYRTDLRAILLIAIPISLQSLIQSVLGMIDQVMVGQLGEVAVAATGIANKPSFIMMYTLFGVTAAASIYAAQYAGSGESKGLARVMRATLVSGLAIVAIFSAAVYSAPRGILGIFSTDRAVIDTGTTYLLITSASFVLLMITLSCSSILRSTGRQNIPLITGLCSVAANTALNAVLIFGLFGFPALGVAGAAIATVIARTLEAIALVIIMRITKSHGRIGEAITVGFDKGFFAAFMATALPAMVNELLWALGDSAYAAIYGRMGTHEIAAMTLTYPVVGLTIGFFSGLSAAAGIMLGNKLGANLFEEAKALARSFFRIGVVGSAAMGALVVLASGPYVALYNVAPDVRSTAVSIFLVYALIMWIKVSNMIVLGGVIRSGGETKYTLILDMIGTWVIGVPAGLLASFVFHLPVQAVYAIIAIEEAFRLALGLRRMASGKWMRKLE